jgi:hypothetical protein
MLKKLSVLLSLMLVVTLLSLNGCSKSDAPTSPGTTDVQNQSAPTGQTDLNATIDAYENEVTTSSNPSVIMDPLGPRGFLGFLVRALKLSTDQTAAIQAYLQNTYNPALKDAFTALQTATQQAMKDLRAAMTAATTDADRQAARAAYQAAMKSALQTARVSIKTAHDALVAFMLDQTSAGAGLDDTQLALFKKIFRIK